MQRFKIVAFLSVLCFLFAACKNEKKDTTGELISVKHDEKPKADITITKFGLPYPDNLMLDSNSLIFYCMRSFDTSSLIHIQKNSSGIRGIYYEMLPAYHQFVNDFADENSNLLFFEGYSFMLDSAMWQTIKERVQVIVETNDSLYRNETFTDGSKYALYYDLKSSYGNSNHEALYESFDKFLKDSFLEKFIQSRKPRFWRK